jgi:hypothetical protein
MRAILALCALAAGFFWWLLSSREEPDWSAGSWPDAPIQRFLSRPFPETTMAGMRVTSVADFSISAKVLSTQPYTVAYGSELSPLDLALGWGRMSEASVLAEITVNQSGRTAAFFWRSAPPLSLDETIVSSTNLHVIPANAEVRGAVLGLRRGDLAELRGELVNVSGPGGFVWNSSVRRDDSGDGACELMLVRSVRLLDRPAGGGKAHLP